MIARPRMAGMLSVSLAARLAATGDVSTFERGTLKEREAEAQALASAIVVPASGTIQGAIDACGAQGGGVVLVPRGVWQIAAPYGLSLLAGVRLLGEEGAILRRAGACAIVITADQAHGASVERLTIDINYSGNFQTAIHVLDASNFVVRDCSLRTEIEPQWDPARGADTIHAVLGRRCTRLVVEDCIVHQAQIKVGANGGRDNVVRRCKITNAYNCGVSAVVQNDGEVLDGVLIEDIEIDGHRDAGIFVGSDDGRVARGRADNVTVRRIKVGGETHANAVCIQGRLTLSARNWVFEDIDIAVAFDAVMQNAMGLLVTNADDQRCRAEDIRITRFTQANAMLRGIEVRGGIDGLEIENCSAESGVHLHAHGGSITGARLKNVSAQISETVKEPNVITYEADQ